MSFSAFIKDNVDALVADFEAFARTLPAGRTMSTLALRDHSREILLAVAADMALPLSDGQRVAQSEAIAATPASTGTAAAEHGALRQLAGFDMVQLFAEFRALRASVMAFWQGASGEASGAAAVADVIRFNEGMDKALAESVHRYSSEVAASRDMFLAVLGHDLRGPLSGVNMSVLQVSLYVTGCCFASLSRGDTTLRHSQSPGYIGCLLPDGLTLIRTGLSPASKR